jgi:anti-anti-sigma factor
VSIDDTTLPQPLDAPFRCDVEPDRERVTVRPAGEVDLVTAPELQAIATDLLENGFGELVLDLRGLTFIDSSGLRAVLAITAVATRLRARLSVIPAPPIVQRAFVIAGLADRLPFVAP